VVADAGAIEIVPADPQVIYVPVYQPAQVYYDSPYGSPFVTFGIGWPMGAWLDYDCDWGNGNLIFWGNGYSRPANWWRESSRQRDMGHTTVWRPNNHPGAVAASRGDRGWSANSMVRSAAPAVTRQGLAGPAAQRAKGSITASYATPAPVVRSAPTQRSIGLSRPMPAPVARSAPISRTESNGAFIGVHSSSVTRAYSNRGQQSMQTFNRSAPVSRPATSFGGGGAGHSGGRR
jgi:hypothetical protein